MGGNFIRQDKALAATLSAAFGRGLAKQQGSDFFVL
jgi:hypothetical protein